MLRARLIERCMQKEAREDEWQTMEAKSGYVCACVHWWGGGFGD